MVHCSLLLSVSEPHREMLRDTHSNITLGIFSLSVFRLRILVFPQSSSRLRRRSYSRSCSSLYNGTCYLDTSNQNLQVSSDQMLPSSLISSLLNTHLVQSTVISCLDYCRSLLQDYCLLTNLYPSIPAAVDLLECVPY